MPKLKKHSLFSRIILVILPTLSVALNDCLNGDKYLHENKLEEFIK